MTRSRADIVADLDRLISELEDLDSPGGRDEGWTLADFYVATLWVRIDGERVHEVVGMTPRSHPVPRWRIRGVMGEALEDALAGDD